MKSLIDPIPIVDWPSNAGAYGNVPVDLDDPRSADPLVRIGDFGIAGQSFYAREDGDNWPYNAKIDGALCDVWCRSLAAQKLKQANKFLETQGYELHVWDAYRPIACQTALWDFFYAQAPQDAFESDRRNFALNYVSDPTRFNRRDPTTWPSHSTGAAVDLTLRDLETQKLCDMGARFDEASAISHSDAYERLLQREPTADVASICNNRRLLHFAMRQQGFVNYPLEFWHFDWGNQMYVHNLRLLSGSAPERAWYGYIESPEEQVRGRKP
jgi:zinc D-Ala-D-Ala dipeptidase